MTFREDVIWLAGLYEGEGTVALNTGKYILKIAMTDRDVILRARDVLGIGRVYGPYQNGARGKKLISVWVCNERDSYAVLAAIHPWLGERRKADAERALRHYRDRARVAIPQRLKDAIIADHQRTGSTQWALAHRHGVSRSLVQQLVGGKR